MMFYIVYLKIDRIKQERLKRYRLYLFNLNSHLPNRGEKNVSTQYNIFNTDSCIRISFNTLLKHLN